MGVLQELSEIRERLDGLNAQIDARFRMASEHGDQTLKRVCAIEEMLGITGNVTPGIDIRPARDAPNHYGNLDEENNVRLRRIEDSLAKLSEYVSELKSDREFLVKLGSLTEASKLPEPGADAVRRPFGPGGGFVKQQEIPKRQNPPPAVKRAAKMAAAKPAPKRRR